MAVTMDLATALLPPARTELPDLAVEGTVPAGLTGVFLQASTHPAGGCERRPIVSGIEFAGGTARLYRAPNAPAGPPFGPEPGLTAALPSGKLTVDNPLVFRRAVALLGVADPYVWQQDRPARIGLFAGSECWFDLENCFVSRIVNAFEDENRVVLDGIRHDRPGEPGHLYRWELDPGTGMARSRRLTGPADLAIVDGRRSARRHRYVFGVAADELGPVMLARHDLATWRTVERPLGMDVKGGQPVFVPGPGGSEGDGWLLVLTEDPVHRCAALLVLDATDIGGSPVAVVNIPFAMPACWRTTWFVR